MPKRYLQFTCDEVCEILAKHAEAEFGTRVIDVTAVSFEDDEDEKFDGVWFNVAIADADGMDDD